MSIIAQGKEHNWRKEWSPEELQCVEFGRWRRTVREAKKGWLMWWEESKGNVFRAGRHQLCQIPLTILRLPRWRGHPQPTGAPAQAGTHGCLADEPSWTLASLSLQTDWSPDRHLTAAVRDSRTDLPSQDLPRFLTHKTMSKINGCVRPLFWDSSLHSSKSVEHRSFSL